MGTGCGVDVAQMGAVCVKAWNKGKMETFCYPPTANFAPGR